MAFPQFQFPRAAVKREATTETTIRIQRMKAIHRNLWTRMHLKSRVNLQNRVKLQLCLQHGLHGVARDHPKIRRLKHEMIHKIRLNREIQLIHKTQPNRMTLLSHTFQSNRVTQQRDELCVSHKIRGIQSNHSRLLTRKSQSIPSSCHAIRMNRWNDGHQLLTDRQKRPFQPKHLNKPNEPIS